MKYTRSTFTVPQRNELAKLGLMNEQVEALESTAMRMGAAALRNEDAAPARQAVSEEFARVADALSRACDVLSDLESARDEVPSHSARLQVRGRIEIACEA